MKRAIYTLRSRLIARKYSAKGLGLPGRALLAVVNIVVEILMWPEALRINAAMRRLELPHEDPYAAHED